VSPSNKGFRWYRHDAVVMRQILKAASAGRLAVLLAVLLASCAHQHAATKIYVQPSTAYLSFHLVLPSDWSVGREADTTVVSAPDGAAVLILREFPRSERSLDDCALAQLGTHDVSAATRSSVISANSRSVVFRGHRPLAEGSAALEAFASLGACFETSTQLDYPMVAIQSAPNVSLERYGSQVESILDSLTFRPAFSN
jgi:hypothetical protein